MKELYVLLTRSPSMLSRSIRLVTNDKYTHSSLAFDPRLLSMCSFGRKVYFLPFPGGLVHEPLKAGYYKFHDKIPCELFSLSVDDEVYERAVELTQKMFSEAEMYHYNVRGLLKCRKGIEFERDGYFFCSQFVAKILQDSGAIELPKPPSLMRPLDYESIPQIKRLYCGQLNELKRLIESGKLFSANSLGNACQ